MHKLARLNNANTIKKTRTQIAIVLELTVFGGLIKLKTLIK